MSIGSRRVTIEHAHLSRVAGSVALEDLDRRRLARTVGPEKRKHLSRVDLEVDPANNLVLAIGLAQPADGDRRLCVEGTGHPATVLSRARGASGVFRRLPGSSARVCGSRPLLDRHLDTRSMLFCQIEDRWSLRWGTAPR